MATLKAVIRTTHKLSDGKCNVKIRVTHNKKVRYIKTEYYVFPANFSDKAGKVIKGGEVDERLAERMNGRLAMKIGICHNKLERHFDELPRMSIQTVLRILREEKEHYDFYALLDDQIKTLDNAGQESYRDMFRNTRRMLEQFTRDFVLPFDAITMDWLKEFERFVGKNKKINTVSIHMRNIRTVYNMAIRKGLAGYAAYPFRGYRIPRQKTAKRNLSVEEIQRIIAYDPPEARLGWIRDMFMLSFYLIGINMKDLFYLRSIDYDPANERITYVRAKGKQFYDIKVYPEAAEIILRYGGSAFMPDETTSKKPTERLLLDVMEGRYQHHKTAIKMINGGMRRIAYTVKVRPDVTTYHARHSWATIASRLGVSRDIIRYALGHGINTVTDIYVDFDQDQVDRANRMVIDHVNRSPASPSP